MLAGASKRNVQIFCTYNRSNHPPQPPSIETLRLVCFSSSSIKTAALLSYPKSLSIYQVIWCLALRNGV